jgi:hypothetical protein
MKDILSVIGVLATAILILSLSFGVINLVETIYDTNKRVEEMLRRLRK